MRLLLLLLLLPTPVFAIETTAEQAYMVDFDTGVVLFEKNATQPMTPSSMSKIMTAYVVFDRLKKGDARLTDELPVSEKAWRTEGSRMFLQLDTMASIEDLLKGVIVQSGNDACVVLAEGLGGSEAEFSEELTRKAHELGAKHSTFLNATGLPDEGHLSTAKDLAIIADRTIRDFPEYYAKYYALKDFSYNNITQGNRNTLLSKNMGVDGLKTGHTDAGGYGTVVSGKQGDRRIILVVNGLKSMNERHLEAMKLLNWGFSHTKNYCVAKKGVAIDTVDVWGGDEKTVPVMAAQDAIITLPRHHRRHLVAKLIFMNPVAAPLKKGDPVGVIEISAPEHKTIQVPLVAAKDVGRAWFHQRIQNAVLYLLMGKQ